MRGTAGHMDLRARRRRLSGQMKKYMVCTGYETNFRADEGGREYEERTGHMKARAGQIRGNSKHAMGGRLREGEGMI